MSRFVPQRDMSAEEILDCISQAEAIMILCANASDSVFNDIGDRDVLACAMNNALKLAIDLTGPVRDALASHEGLKGGAE